MNNNYIYKYKHICRVQKKTSLNTFVLVTSMFFVTCCFRAAPEDPARFLEDYYISIIILSLLFFSQKCIDPVFWKLPEDTRRFPEAMLQNFPEGFRK